MTYLISFRCPPAPRADIDLVVIAVVNAPTSKPSSLAVISSASLLSGDMEQPPAYEILSGSLIDPKNLQRLEHSKFLV